MQDPLDQLLGELPPARAPRRREPPRRPRAPASTRSAPPAKAAPPSGLNPQLQSHVNDMLSSLRASGYDVRLGATLRTPAQQAEKVAQGNSRTSNSRHLTGPPRRRRSVAPRAPGAACWMSSICRKLCAPRSIGLPCCGRARSSRRRTRARRRAPSCGCCARPSLHSSTRLCARRSLPTRTRSSRRMPVSIWRCDNRRAGRSACAKRRSFHDWRDKCRA